MFFETPLCQRCCFCFPLRRGIIGFGYLNILCSSLFIAAINYDRVYNTIHGTGYMEWDTTIAYIYRALDIFFSVILIVGGHTNWIIGLKIFFYYTCFTLVSIFIFQITELAGSSWFFTLIFEIGCFLISAIIHVYLLLQINSLVHKLEHSTPGDGVENQMHEFGREDLFQNDEETDHNIVIPVQVNT